MDNKIDYRYFWGKIKLPYLNILPFKDTPSSNAASDEIMELDRQISRYQKEYLISLFGSEVVPEQVESYIVDEDSFISPLANYVYCKILSNYQSSSTAAGITVKQIEVSSVISYQENLYDAWNDMVKMNCTIRDVLETAGLTDTYVIDPFINGRKKDFWSLKFWI